MREIIFRGKHVHMMKQNEHLNGMWIYGYLEDENYINSPELEGEFLVDPQTVGQYTGLKDRNGKKIFEGDILRVRFREARIGAEEKHYNYIVKYDEYRAEFGLFGNENLYGRPIFEECNQPIMEVVGNIFDNSELMKGA